MSNFYTDSNDMTPEQRIEALETEVARIKSEHESLLERCAFREDFEWLTRSLDDRLSRVVISAEAPQQPVAVAEAPKVSEPPADQRAEITELRALVVDMIHLVVPALASGHLSTERAASLIDRASQLAGRAVTGA